MQPVSTMANVVDTKLYDILGVSPSASENELKKVGAADKRRAECTTQKTVLIVAWKQANTFNVQ